MSSDIARAEPGVGAPLRATSSRRLSTETKQAFKTTELWAYVATVVGILIAGAATKAGDQADDRLTSGQVWLYVSIVTLGYLLSRGLAKSGSRDPYYADERE